MRSHFVLLVSIVSVAVPVARAERAPRNCEALKARAPAHTSIVSAEVVPAGAFKVPAPIGPGPRANFSILPAFCRVIGSIQPTADSDVRFELWLPEAGWNGKFVQTGNGGAAGAIVHASLAEPLARGFAVANTDTGHRGDGADFSWAVAHSQKLTDFASRAVHELTVAGKAITEVRYGKAPEKSYWDGCSTGGRQGLIEAQRFPADYDAIIAGAPASNWSPLMAQSVLVEREMTAPEGLSARKLVLLREAAITSCDALDGVADRVITDPRRCHFDPTKLECTPGETTRCLTTSEVAAAQRIYRGVVTKDGKTRLPGTGPGSESEWAAYAGPFKIGSSYFRSVVMQDPRWDAAQFDVDADLARADQLDGGALDAMNPDLGRFFARGGKLITYHGTTDGLIPHGNSVNYYESVVAKLGTDKVEKGMRLYLVPGMDHCWGGAGAFVIDWLGALDAWVSTNKAPDALPSLRPAQVPPGPPGAPPAPSGKAFTRPACVYPQVARYNGTGETSEASSFQCVVP